MKRCRFVLVQEMKSAIVSRLVAGILIAAFTASGNAQQAPALSKKAAAIQRKVASLPLHSRISVIRVHGGEEFGELLSLDPEGFTFHDIDRKVDVSLQYDEVRKVKKGYGGYNYARGRHVDRTTNLVVAGITVAAIGVLIGAVAAAKN